MLGPDLLRLRPRGEGLFEPGWLGERDEVWLREVLHAVDARAGKRAGRLERDLLSDLAQVARDHAVDRRALRGAVKVALLGYRRTVDARLDPAKVRELVFQEAARARLEASAAGVRFSARRGAVIAAASSALGATAEEIESSLFADHPAERLLSARSDPSSPSELRHAYHLALVQGCLLRSSHVDLWVRSHVRSVVRFAKLARLLCTCTEDGGATKVALSGPLALFHETLKYGRALARFIPTVFSTPSFIVEAHCLLDEGPVRVVVDARAPLPRPHALPAEADSRLEAALARDLRRLGSGWRVVREGSAVQIGSTVLFPDFVLEREGARVLVEVVGFWTPEYLRSKLQALRSIRGAPLVVAVAAHAGWSPEDVPGAEVVVFERKFDASAIVRAAERAFAAERARAAEQTA